METSENMKKYENRVPYWCFSISPEHSIKGTNAEASILGPPDAKNRLIGKDLMLVNEQNVLRMSL